MNILSQDPKEKEFKFKKTNSIAIKPSAQTFGKTMQVFQLICKKVREGRRLEVEDHALERDEIKKIEKYQLIGVFNPTWNETYAHGIIDIIPQLMHLDKEKKYQKIFTCLTPTLRKIIDGLNLNFERITFISETGLKFRAVKIDIFEHHPYAKIRNKELIKVFKEKIDKIKGNPKSKPKFIYCSRNDKNESFKNSQNRRTMHEEVEKIIIELSKNWSEKNDLEFVMFNGSNPDKSEMEVKDQMKLFKDAKVVVAPHGGALANLISVKKSNKCKVCEFTGGLNSEIQGVGNFAKNYNSLLGTLPETYLDYNLIPFNDESKYNNKRIDLRNYLDFLESIK